MSRPLLLTLGDPAGIGPEITMKAWLALKDQPDLAFGIIAPLDALSRAAKRFDVPLKSIDSPGEIAGIFQKALPVLPIEGAAATPGAPDSIHADAVTRSISRAVQFCLDGQAAAVVTNPIAKEMLYGAGFEFPGHTEFLGHLTRQAPPPYARGPVMMLAAQDLRVGLATVHLPLAKAAATLTSERILEVARVMIGALKTDFGIAEPRLALTGLNPHAGEGGALGTEEGDIINPAARVLRAEGHDVTDAQPADTLFHAEARMGYDAVLAMYHDQGLIPVKTIDFHGGVNITLGLPIIRTSPDHGTAFGIAGQGVARADSLIAAIRKARELSNCRTSHVAG